ncbi:MAG: 30S ribosomal protein S18 [candidate division Zixibacteria bacterium]|nr:30S ribosomal protein S18 [candidate division Zixibacteria bacterium]MDD5426642.1 30S ribosomal protein S18 [candidate division Zixibacteria bacterium]
MKNYKPREKKVVTEFTNKRRKKICRFCENNIDFIDFKDDRLLRRFVTERGKIVPRRISGNCAIHQRKLTKAIKRGRHMAIMAFESESYR